MKQLVRPHFIIIGLMLTLFGCGWQKDKPVRIAAHVWAGYETLFLTQSEGWLDRMRVSLVETTSATDSLKALAEGRIDGAALTLDEVLRARANGLPLTVVMVFDISAGADALISRPPFKTLVDLKGQRIGYEPGAVGALMLAEALKAGGLKKEEVMLIPLSVDKQLDAWRQNRVDALVSYEPVLSQLMDEGGVKLFDSRQLPDTIVDVLVMRTDVLDGAHAAAIRHLISAHFHELEHIYHNPQDAAYRMASHLNLPADKALGVFKGMFQPDLVENHRLLDGNSPPLNDAARKISRLMVEEKMLPKDDNLASLLRADFLPTEK